MICYCSKCDINWIALWTSEGEWEEVYEFCPECKSSLDLGPGTDILAYIKCQVTGRILNPENGQELIREISNVITHPRRKKVWDESYEEWKLRCEVAEDEYIDECAASTAPNKVQYPTTDRKHHFVEQ
ncbi:MAG: hypothetical protein ABIT05_01210 [Chitinophagaceae bacterium]